MKGTAESYARIVSLELKENNNNESAYEHEVQEFVRLFETELLKLNGYN
jgi:hypothetical protein